MGGTNVEISNKLTLIRRPGNSVFDSNPWNAVNRFYDFRLSDANTEEILIMVDQANALYSLNNGKQTLIFQKSTGAGQSYMQSVGNTLYFGNGVDNKKYLQSLLNGPIGGQWKPNQAMNTATGQFPYLTTYFLDPNENIQQLTGAILPVGSVYAQNDTVQIFTGTANQVIQAGDQVTFPQGMVASFLDGQTVTVLAAYPNTFVFNFITANYAQTNESNVYASVELGEGQPTTGATQPIWSLTQPGPSNLFQGGLTYDGTAVWTNRGNPVENWGIQMPTAPVTTTVNGGLPQWNLSTLYSLVSCIIDSNGNLQQVTVAGTSGAAPPLWNTVLGGVTYDGAATTGVTWKMIASAAMMNWQANTLYPVGSFIVETAAGVPCLFQSQAPGAPYLSSSVQAYLWAAPHSGTVGQWDGVHPYRGTNNPSGLPYPTDPGSSYRSAGGLTGFDFSISGTGTGGSFIWNTINAAGETTGTTNPFPGVDVSDNYIIVTGVLQVPVAGSYVFTITHGDGLQWGIGGNATFVSGTTPTFISGTNTALNGYPVFPAGHNQNVTSNSGNAWVDSYTINFPSTGTYPIEINMARWDKNNAQLKVQCAGHTLASGQPTGGGTSGSIEPTWPAWTLADAPAYPNVIEGSGRLQWTNIGPASDFVWQPAQHMTLANTQIVDTNNNTQGPYRSGYTGATGGPPIWAANINQLSVDNPNLVWINLGPNGAAPVGTITTKVGGWVYAVSLVNTLDSTVSNATRISAPTGNFTNAQGIILTPGDGLPPLSEIDPQADYVAIWRSTDGQVSPFLIPSSNTDYSAPITISLHDYLLNGYTDTTPDVDLNNLISAPILGENTPPASGAINLSYYLNRLFYSIGTTVYYTTGPATPVGNGLNGTAPLNFDGQASLVKRIIPTTSGAFVFTVSDINLIQPGSTSAAPVLPASPLIEGVGLLSYNALDVNGSTIGFFTTDHQFCIIDPSSGISSAGFPLGDQFRLNDGQPGQSWNPKNVYVAWHVNGEDQAWYVADGASGWYRMMATPAPENGGFTWSPFAQIAAGVKALQSIEVTPGNHQLLLGPVGTGTILERDLDVNSDGGVPYLANAVLGSCVLAQPGQIALVPFITTESVGIGAGIPLTLGVLIDEAIPYYPGPFNNLKHWVNDPPNLVPSISMPSQRFYLSEDGDSAAAMRSMQIQINWAAIDAPSELLTITIYGGFLQES